MPEFCRNCEICEAQKVCPQDAFIREKKDDKPWIDFYQGSVKSGMKEMKEDVDR